MKRVLLNSNSYEKYQDLIINFTCTCSNISREDSEDLEEFYKNSGFEEYPIQYDEKTPLLYYNLLDSKKESLKLLGDIKLLNNQLVYTTINK